MNLEELILDTQISELKRLQSGCIKARDSIQRIQSLTAQLDDQAARAKAEIQGTQDAKTQRQIERVEVEAKKLREQTAKQTSSKQQAARAARTEQIRALNAQLKQDIADCQQQLQSKMRELRNTEDRANTLLNLEPQEEVLSNEITNDLPEFELSEPEHNIVHVAVPSQHKEIDQKVSGLEQQVRDAIQKKFGARSKAFSSLPVANVDLSSAGSETKSVSDHFNLALDAAERFNTKKPAIWGRGLPLLILGALLFCAGTMASAVSKIDLGSLMSFDLSEPDFTWIGISCGIGLAFSVILGLILRKLAYRGVKQAAQELLLHTSNAKAVAEHQKINIEPEFTTLKETPTPPMALLKSIPQENPIVSKPELKEYDHQREAELQTAAYEQINSLVSRHAEQMDQHFAQFEEQIPQFKSESGEANSPVETWRNKELSRIQNHSATSLEQAFSKLAQEVQAKHDQLSTEAATQLSRWKANVLIASEVARISNDRSTQFPAWEHFCSQGWTVPSSLPATLTAGDIRLTMPAAPETADGKIESALNIQLPGLLNFPRDASMAIEHDANGREPAVDFVRAIALRLLTSLAPGQILFTLIAPASPEQSFSGLTQLAKYNEQLIDGQVWSDSSQIEISLRRVSERMDRVLKAFLQSGANSLDEHNAMSADSKEPYHFVLVAGFPKDFTDEAARHLTSILNGGALCGVHAIVMWSAELALPRSFKTKTLQKNCTQFQVKNGAVQAGSSLSANNSEGTDDLVQFVAIQSPNLDKYESIVSAVGEKLQPMKIVQAASIPSLTPLEQPTPPESPVESFNSVDAVTTTAVEVPAVSYSTVEPIFVSSSTIESAVIDDPVAENPPFESNVAEPEAMAQGIAAIPIAQCEEQDTSSAITNSEDVPVQDVPVQDQVQDALVEDVLVNDVLFEDVLFEDVPVTETVPLAIAVAESAIDEAAVPESSDVTKESVDQSSTPEPATTASAPAIQHCTPLNEKLTHEFIDSHADGVPVWIGESSTDAVTSNNLLRARGQNTLIVGQNDDLADSLFASTILSLCAGQASRHARSPRVILVHDGMNQESLRKFAASFSDAITPRFVIRSAAGVDSVLAELLEEMNVREKNQTAKDAPEIIFGVRNIGQFPTLRRDYENTQKGSSKSASVGSRFGDLLRQGPRVGIHVMIWADTFETALQCLSNSLLRECDTRIALTMHSRDSVSLISSPNAASIGDDAAILYSEQTGSLHQFQPFAWPSGEWLATLPQSTVNIANEASETPQSDIISKDSLEEQTESSDSDGFTLAPDVVPTETVVQPTNETSPGDVASGLPDTQATSVVPAPLPAEDSGNSTAPEKATRQLMPDSVSAKSKSGKRTRGPAVTVPSSQPSETEIPAKAATSPPNVVASSEAAATQKENPSPPEKRVTGMATRMSARNSDPLRPLDAPPERPVQVVSEPPGSIDSFDEMDFNSIMIE